VNSATWTSIQSNALYLGGATYNSTAATGDGGIWPVDLSAGTWNLSVLVEKGTGIGQLTVDVSYDGGVTFTTLINAADNYAASYTGGVNTATGVVVPTGGTALVRFRCLGKNASSTTYAIGLSSMTWTRTA
jgi:hypothetical protein